MSALHLGRATGLKSIQTSAEIATDSPRRCGYPQVFHFYFGLPVVVVGMANVLTSMRTGVTAREVEKVERGVTKIKKWTVWKHGNLDTCVWVADTTW